MTDCIPQLVFSFYRHQPIHADFSGGQITSDAGLLPLRAFDQRHHLTRDLAQLLSDPRQGNRLHHDSLALLRQRIYQIVAGYEDANDADRLRHDPLLQIVADQPLGQALGSQPTLSRWENAPSARDLVLLNDALLEQFLRLCGEQVRKRGEILLDIDSTDDPTHGQQQLSFFNGAYDQHMYHPMLIFERHTGCLLATRLRPGSASSHARIVPMLLRLVPRLQAAFPSVQIKLRGDAGFALPLLYLFCEFFGIQYAFGIPANCVFQQHAEPWQKQLKRRYGGARFPVEARLDGRVFVGFHIDVGIGDAVLEPLEVIEGRDWLWETVNAMMQRENIDEGGLSHIKGLDYLTLDQLGQLVLVLIDQVFPRLADEMTTKRVREGWQEALAKVARLRNQVAHLRNVRFQDMEDLARTLDRMRRDVIDYGGWKLSAAAPEHAVQEGQ